MSEIPPAVATLPILAYFEYNHLPPYLQDVSRPFYWLAHESADALRDAGATAELVAGLRKLLEAKDCFVRAAVTKGRSNG